MRAYDYAQIQAGAELDKQIIRRIDPEVLARVARTPRATQRWLKTALHTIRTMPSPREVQDDYEPPPSRPPGRRARLAEPPPERPANPPDLDDMLTGRAGLKDQLEAHPELAEELEGLSDIIDMLKDAGKRRRELGQDALADEMRRAAEEDEEPDDDV